MTNIIESSRDYTKQDIFRMTHNSESLKNIPEGEVLTVAGWAVLETTREPEECDSGEVVAQSILIMETLDIENKSCYIATQSDVVYRELMDIWEAFVDGVTAYTVDVVHALGTSKSGRTFHIIRVV